MLAEVCCAQILLRAEVGNRLTARLELADESLPLRSVASPNHRRPRATMVASPQGVTS